jgi:hypothetical protein
MIPIDIKNLAAKCIVLIWIAFLVNLSMYLLYTAVTLDLSALASLQGNSLVKEGLDKEIRLLMMMLAIALVGGIWFMIKDFYRSVKNANLYSSCYADYVANILPYEEFQKIITLNIYIARFNHTWLIWFIIQPLLSAMLGLVAYFIARSGLGVLASWNTATELSIQSLYLYAVLTFLAGFSSHKFIAWLDRLADKIFSSTLPESNQATKEQIKTAANQDRKELSETLESPVSTQDEKDTIALKTIR